MVSKLSLKLYHLSELRLGYQQLMTEAPIPLQMGCFVPESVFYYLSYKRVLFTFWPLAFVPF